MQVRCAIPAQKGKPDARGAASARRDQVHLGEGKLQLELFVGERNRFSAFPCIPRPRPFRPRAPSSLGTRLGALSPAVPGARGPAVRVEREESGIEPPGHGARVIRGGIIDDDALVVPEPGGREALQAAIEKRTGIIYGHDDRESHVSTLLFPSELPLRPLTPHMAPPFSPSRKTRRHTAAVQGNARSDWFPDCFLTWSPYRTGCVSAANFAPNRADGWYFMNPLSLGGQAVISEVMVCKTGGFWQPTRSRAKAARDCRAPFQIEARAPRHKIDERTRTRRPISCEGAGQPQKRQAKRARSNEDAAQGR